MEYQAAYKAWLDGDILRPEERGELLAIAEDEKEIESRFFAPLEFGTAGLRGILGMGRRRMNVYVVRQATQAMAELIAGLGEQAKKRGCAVCFDCRHKSREFAKEAAMVLAGNGVRVRLFENLRPTPELSFAIRRYGCVAGINITASHNPKEYNGYKVYWEDGAQMPPPEAEAVAERMAAVDVFTGPKRMDFDKARASGLISLMGEETDEAFLRAVFALQVNPGAVQAVADRMKLVYTPFHGTGYLLVPEILRRIGYRHVLCVPEQMAPDGDFPTVKSPNPEDKEGFALAIRLAREHDVDLIIGTDPDCDRTGIMLRDGRGEYVTLSGDQVGVLLADYIITSKKRRGTLPASPAVIKTIVSSEMTRAVCQKHGVACFDTFTGFKHIAELIGKFEREKSYRYIFAYEESYGYMAGDHARDKDGVTASMLIGEMAAWYRGQGMTLYDAMEAMYDTYGFFSEKTVNLFMPGLDGLRDMRGLMERLRRLPPVEIGGFPVASVRDYLSGEEADIKTGKISRLGLSGSDVIYFQLEDGTRFIVRPSGTEPKIKVYILAAGSSRAETTDKTGRLAKEALRLPALLAE